MAKRTRTETSADGENLFKREVQDVRRLQHNEAPTRPRPAARRPSVPSHEVDPTVESGQVLRFLRPGIQEALLSKLRRGQFPIEGTLDLHGYTSTEARLQLSQFLQRARSHRFHAVRIVHGKGRGSSGGPVLKSKIYRWLKEDDSVLAFCSALPQNGGTGALEVLLRRQGP